MRTPAGTRRVSSSMFGRCRVSGVRGAAVSTPSTVDEKRQPVLARHEIDIQAPVSTRCGDSTRTSTEWTTWQTDIS